MKRRQFLALLGGALGTPLALAQATAKRFRVGGLLIGTEERAKPLLKAFEAGLQDRGYAVGQNLFLEVRLSDGDPDRLRALAEELVALKPDVILASEITGLFLKGKTSTIPIVLHSSADPVAAGLVQSLARPGTNVTGMAGLMFPLVTKQVELLTELVPGMSRLAFFAPPFDPPKDNPYYGRPEPWEFATRAAAKAKGLELVVLKVHDSESLRAAFAVLERERPHGLVIPTNAVILRLGDQILEGARRLRLPAVYPVLSLAEGGGLLSYGQNFVENFRYAAKFVDLILRGARPAEIPVEQPWKFELVVNQKTARELGLTIPQSILLRADRVIE